MTRRKRCVYCKEFVRTKQLGDNYIGICGKYGLPVKDSLSGCAERSQQKEERVENDNKKGRITENLDNYED